ncbi:unnamed protein product [Prunus armeniaca]
MTGPPSSSYPSQVSPSAVEISPENRREKLGFARNFAGFVLRRPAAIFGDQVRVRPNFGMRFRPLPVRFWGTSKNKSDSKLGVLPRVLPGSCRIRRIVKRSPGYSGNANHGVRVLVTVRSCDRERSDRPIWTKLAGRAS